ncbi:sensor histidine kinase [Microcella sp.]|uniref:sensor histidine kinase n=1 Tax=Microcella sp. TaxID=1913979 RepID=UPI0039189CB4
MSDVASSILVAVAVAATIGMLVAVAVATVASSRLRQHRAAAQETADRARELEIALGEQSARLRLIREQHDIAAHRMSGVVQLAEGASSAATRDPGIAARAADQIAASARTTLAELRRVVTATTDAEQLAAARPALEALDGLFDAMRARGIVVTVSELGDRFPVAEGAGLALYRILEEALANAAQYGGEGTEVRVGLTWSDQGLHVRVDDDGIRAQARREGLTPDELAARGYTIDDDLAALTDRVTGTGLGAMRARAELFGGVVSAQTVPGVGFSVSVVFPALRFHNAVHGVNVRR